MTPIQYIQITVGIVVSLGILAGGLGYLMQSYKKSGRSERSDVVNSADTISDFWKKQAEDYKEMITVKDAENTRKFEALTREVGELRGQLTAEKAQNERLEKIFQGRNPEMETFMKFMVEATNKHIETHKAMLQALKDLHNLTSENNKILDSRKQDVTITGQMATTQPLNK